MEEVRTQTQMTKETGDIPNRCVECFQLVEEPIYNVIGKIGPADHPATFNLSFEEGGNPIGICRDCLEIFWKEQAEGDYHDQS